MAEALDLESLIRSNAEEQKAEIARQAEEQAAFNEQAKAKMQEARALREPEYEKLQQQQTAIAEVQPPKLERPPTAPNTQEMLRPSSLQKQFGMASIFALMAVGIAKGSAIHGLKALGGFMEGAHAGNMEQASAALKDYTAKMEEVKASNDVAMAEYNAIFNNKKYSLEAQERMFRLKALEFNDELALQTMSQQGMNATHRLLQQRSTVDQKMADDLLRSKQIEESMRHHQAMEAAQTASAAGMDSIFGIPMADIPQAPAGQKNEAFLSMLPTARADIVRKVAAGEIDVKTMGGMGKTASEMRRNYNEAAATYDPKYRQQQYGVIDKTLKENTPGGAVGNNVLAVNTLAHHLDDYVEQFAKLNNSQVQRWNAAKNRLATEFGDPALNRLKVPLGLVAAETARVVKGGRAAPTEDEIKFWQSTFDTNASPAQTREVIWQALQGVGGRLAEVETANRSILGPSYRALSPDAAALMIKNKPKNVPVPDWLKPYAQEQSPQSAPPSVPPQRGSRLTYEQAIDLLREAGGDKQKARELARQRGYSF